MESGRTQDYTKWWKRIAVWIAAWIVCVGIVASVAAATSDTQHTASDWAGVPLLGFILAAISSPIVPVFFVWLDAGKALRDEIDSMVANTLGSKGVKGLDWRLVGFLVLVFPLATSGWAVLFDRSFATLSLLAQVDAALVIAIVVDARSVFAIAGVGGPAKSKLTLRLALLALIAIGLLVVVSAAMFVSAPTPWTVSYDLAAVIGLGYGFSGFVAALLLLALSAGRHILTSQDLESDSAPR